MSLLTVKKLSMSYDNRSVLHDVSFSVEKGDWLCIVGENGSGKTTLLKGLAGLLPLHGGEIVFGEGVKPDRIGYLPQQTNIQKNFPACVCEVVLSGCRGSRLFRFHSAADKKRVDKVIEELGIEELHHKSYGDLSGGQQQRVLLARALCATESLLLLDEPVTGLDPIVTNEMYSLIERLNRQSGITVIMVSHDIASAVKYAGKILHIDSTVEFFGSTAEYIENDLGKRFSGGEAQ